jgi:hypothetical protein
MSTGETAYLGLVIAGVVALMLVLAWQSWRNP